MIRRGCARRQSTLWGQLMVCKGRLMAFDATAGLAHGRKLPPHFLAIAPAANTQRLPTALRGHARLRALKSTLTFKTHA
jgi:hypothetical protein